jgi:hypothetical protein
VLSTIDLQCVEPLKLHTLLLVTVLLGVPHQRQQLIANPCDDGVYGQAWHGVTHVIWAWQAALGHLGAGHQHLSTHSNAERQTVRPCVVIWRVTRAVVCQQGAGVSAQTYF